MVKFSQTVLASDLCLWCSYRRKNRKTLGQEQTGNKLKQSVWMPGQFLVFVLHQFQVPKRAYGAEEQRRHQVDTSCVMRGRKNLLFPPLVVILNFDQIKMTLDQSLNQFITIKRKWVLCDSLGCFSLPEKEAPHHRYSTS